MEFCIYFHEVGHCYYQAFLWRGWRGGLFDVIPPCIVVIDRLWVYLLTSEGREAIQLVGVETDFLAAPNHLSYIDLFRCWKCSSLVVSNKFQNVCAELQGPGSTVAVSRSPSPQSATFLNASDDAFRKFVSPFQFCTASYAGIDHARTKRTFLTRSGAPLAGSVPIS